MAKFYIKFQTMSRLIQVDAKCSLNEALNVVCQAEEFQELRFLSGEKAILNNINKSVKFPIKGKRVKDISDKVSLLIQSTLGQAPINSGKLGPLMQQELISILSTVKRVARCLVEVCTYFQYCQATLHSLNLERCLNAKVWNDGFILRQLDGIGNVLAGLFKSNRISSIADLRALDGRQIESIVNRNPPFGNQLLDKVEKFPEFIMTCNLYQEIGKPRDLDVFVEIHLKNSETAELRGKVQVSHVQFNRGECDEANEPTFPCGAHYSRIMKLIKLTTF